jgi:hypothetical protein
MDPMQPDINALVASMRLKAQAAVLGGTEWVPTEHFGDAAERWRQERRLFRVRVGDRDCFPRYALDSELRPLPAIASVISTLPHYSEPGLAMWFESTSRFLGGARPRELIAHQPDLVIRAAEDAAEAEKYAS